MGFEKPDSSAATASREWTGIRLSGGESPIRASLNGLAELDTGAVGKKRFPRRPAAGGRPAFLAGLNVLRDDIRNTPRQAVDLGGRLLEFVARGGEPVSRSAADGHSDHQPESGRLPLDTVGHEVEIDLQPSATHYTVSAAEKPAVSDMPPPAPPNLADYRDIVWPDAAAGVSETVPAAASLPGVETASPPTVESAPPVTSQSERRTVDELSRAETLKIAKDIMIDGVRLKDIYNAKRLDMDGLRAVVETYLHGGDVRQQLSREIIAKEQSFERDPQLRHRHSGDQDRTGTATKPAKPDKAQDISHAVAAVRRSLGRQGKRLAAVLRPHAKSTGRLLARGAKKAHHELIDNGDTAQWVSITAIVVVYALIILLLFT